MVGCGLRNRLDQQLLHLATEGIALHPGRASVNDVSDARNRERGFRHVGGQHDAPPRMAVEDTVLLGLGQAREQRQHLGAAQHRRMLQVLAQVVGRLADLALAGQKDQDVAALAAGPELVHAIGNRIVEIEVLLLLEGLVAHLHRVGAARDHDHRRRPVLAFKVLGKALGIDGGRGHDHLEVRTLGQDLPYIAQQKIDVQAALVGFIDDQRVVGAQQRIGLGLGQQNAVRHQLDRGAFLQRVLETHLVAHDLAQRRLELLGNALGHAGGRNTPRLGMAYELALAPLWGVDPASAQRQRDLGQLRGLARAGLAANDDDLMAVHGLHDLVTTAGYGELFGESDLQGHGGATMLAALRSQHPATPGAPTKRSRASK